MHPPLLADIVILLVVSIGVLYASHQVRLPPIVGFLITGMLLGPQALGLVHGVEEVQQLAEIGIILLLFTIGLEFSLADLLRMRKLLLVGGTVQVVGVTLVAWAGLALLGVGGREAFFLGMIASLSSTAVVLRLFQQRGEVDSPHGRASLAILVYQDLMIVPMILVIPVLAGTSAGLGSALAIFALKSVAVLVLTVVLARFVVPQLLDRVVRTRNRDLFLLTVVSICLAVALGAAATGLSLALGAFLAGLLISESEYSHQALADILPFRDLFASFFFISIGMLLDLRLVASEPLLLGGLVGAVLALKVLAAFVATLALGLSFRTALATGLAMSQVGEFSFVLAGSGLAAGLLAETSYQWFVAAAVATIGATPFMVGATRRLADALERLPLGERLRRGTVHEEPGVDEQLEGHLIVIGYGVNGRNVVRAARVAGIPFVALDMNPSLVQTERTAGVPIHYGDATRHAVLEHLGAAHARAVVIAISDAAATRRITALARTLNPHAKIIARTRYVAEMESLHELGATTVIPEELETSIEIVAQVLASYLVPRRESEAFIAEIRAGGYEMLRSPSSAVGAGVLDLKDTLTDVEVSTMRVDGDSPLVGQRLAESDLRALYGISVVAIRRGGEIVPNPGGDQCIEAGDALIVLGLGEEIAAATELLGGRGGDAIRP